MTLVDFVCEEGLGGLEMLDDLGDIFVDSIVNDVSAAFEDFFDGGLDWIDHRAQMAGRLDAGLDGIDRRLDCAALAVAEHDDQRRAQVLDGVFDASHAGVIGGVAGDAHDKQFAEAGIEDDLRRNTRIRTAQHDRDRMLTGRQRSDALRRSPRMLELTGDKAGVALEQLLERRVRPGRRSLRRRRGLLVFLRPGGSMAQPAAIRPRITIPIALFRNDIKL